MFWATILTKGSRKKIKVLFLVTRPGAGKGLAIKKKKTFFEALKKYPQKYVATKLEGEGGKSQKKALTFFCGFP